MKCNLEKPEVEPPQHPGLDLHSAVKKLETRSYDTYRARIQAARRLHSRYNGWNLALVGITSGLLIASVGLLVDHKLYGPHSDALIVCLSVVALVLSLVISNAGFGGRSRSMELGYKQIQALSLEAEQFFLFPENQLQAFAKLQDRYNALIADSENHTTSDFHRSKGCTAWSKCCLPSALNTAIPFALLVIPISLCVPLVAALV